MTSVMTGSFAGVSPACRPHLSTHGTGTGTAHLSSVGSVPCAHACYMCECGTYPRDLYENSTYRRGLRERLRTASPGVVGVAGEIPVGRPLGHFEEGLVSPLPW